MASVSSSKSHPHERNLAAGSTSILVGWVSHFVRMMREVWIDAQELRLAAHRHNPFVDC